MKKLLQHLERSPLTWFLLALLFIFFLLRLPSLTEPYWYGDEAIYETVAQAMDHGSMLYTGIWDNKPPLLYLMYALVQGDQFGAKVLSLLFGLGAVITFFFLAKKVFDKKFLVFLSTSIFAFLLASPLTEGNIANAENFMLFPILLSALIIYTQYNLKHANQTSPLRSSPFAIRPFLAGFLLGIAFLYKTVAIFDLFAFVLFIVVYSTSPQTTLKMLLHPSNLKHQLSRVQLQTSHLSPLLIGFFLPLFVTMVYFALNHSLWAFMNSIFSSNIGYVGQDNTFIIPQGFLLIKLFILVLVVTRIFVRRHVLNKPSLFILLWLAFSTFDSFFSQRNYTHYFLVMTPALSLVIGLFWMQINKYRPAIFFCVAVIILISFYYFIGTRYKNLLPYYINFIQYYNGQKKTEAYQSFFDHTTPRDYLLADFLRTHTTTGSHIFIWGNSPQIYVLSHTLPVGRYTVAYHITDNPDAELETELAIAQTKPRYVIVLSDAPELSFPIIGYQPTLNISGNTIYERSY